MKRLIVYLLAQLLVLPAFAATTYTYTGNPFAAFSPNPGYDTTMRVTGWFRVGRALPTNSYANYASEVLEYSFSDGINTIAGSDPHAVIVDFHVGTDAAGNIRTDRISIVAQRWATTPGLDNAYNEVRISNFNDGFSGGKSNVICGLMATATSCGGYTLGSSGRWGTTSATAGNPQGGAWSTSVYPRRGTYSDLWWNPTEGGWGMQVAQSGSFQFLTFFIYGSDGKPTWYTAELNQDPGGSFNGPLYVNTGSYFGSPWVPGAVTSAVAGNASFQPSDAYHATLAYTITGGPTVSKAIEREPLTELMIAGSYTGAISGSVTGCDLPAGNRPALSGNFDLVISQVGAESAMLVFTFADSSYGAMACTLTGPLTHLGSLYRMAGAQYTCTVPGSAPTTLTAVVEQLHPTRLGVEGAWTANSAGCTQAISFTGVAH